MSGMAIERFQAFAVYKNQRHITRCPPWQHSDLYLRKFSIGWFLSSWTLSILFVIVLLPQIRVGGELGFGQSIFGHLSQCVHWVMTELLKQKKHQSLKKNPWPVTIPYFKKKFVVDFLSPTRKYMQKNFLCKWTLHHKKPFEWFDTSWVWKLEITSCSNMTLGVKF